MNVIVTNNKVDYDGFLKVKSLQDALEVRGSVEFFVYHKSSEATDLKVSLLTKIKDQVKTMIYIRNKESVEQAVQMIVIGSEGKYIDDEFFLESSDELNKLISNMDEISSIVSLGGVSVLSDFFNRYLKDGSASFNPSYLAVVKDAVATMISEYSQKSTEIINLSTTATELFANSTEILGKMKAEQEKMQNAVLQLESAKESIASAGNTFGLPSVVFFPTVNYLKEKDIIRVKDVGGCIYLTSLMMGFRLYLEHIKFRRPKLIFIEPVGMQYEKKYKNYPWVTQFTYKSMEGYYNPIVFTNYPTKDVMGRLLDDKDYDTFIVVDKLRTSKSHVLNCKGGNVRYAVSGKSAIEKFQLSVVSCFSTISQIPGSMFTVPVFPEYPEAVDQRERIYLRSCENFYEILYSVKRR